PDLPGPSARVAKRDVLLKPSRDIARTAMKRVVWPLGPGSRSLRSLVRDARPLHCRLGIVHALDEKSAELPRALRATASAFSEVLSLLPCSSARARNARRRKREAITHRGWSSPLIASLSMTALRARMCRSASSRRRRLSSGVIAGRFDNTLLHITAGAIRVRMIGDSASEGGRAQRGK